MEIGSHNLAMFIVKYVNKEIDKNQYDFPKIEVGVSMLIEKAIQTYEYKYYIEGLK